METEKSYIPNLNGLRFLGAFLVFIFHIFKLEREIWRDFTESGWFQILYKGASKGHHGVGLFFALSGFLITFLLLSEAKKNGAINVRNFLFRRILRIWPLYFLIVLFGFFIFPLLPYGQETAHSFLNYTMFLSNLDEIWYGANDPLNFLTITWSVSIEEQFYLTLILLMAILPTFRSGKAFKYYFFGLVLLVILFRYLYFYDERIMYYHTLSNISDLALGGLGAIGVLKYNWNEKLASLSRTWIIGIYLVGLTLIAGSTFLFVDELRSVERLLIGSFFAFIVLEQAYCQNSFFKMDKFPGFFNAGKLTYGIYMFHVIYIYYWSIFFKNQGLTDNFGYFIIYGLLVFVSTYFTAWLSMRYLEGPLLKLKRNFR